MNKSCLSTEYYATCQEREKAFAARVNGMVPTRIFGPGHFWKNFNRLLRQTASLESPVVHIPADPRHCLAFSSSRQVLWAATLACHNRKANRSSLVDVTAARFGLFGILDRPIRCLSGGETAKTALAKAWIAADTGRPLVMASPSGWLSASNAGFLDLVVERYASASIPVTIMAMEGENDSRPVDFRQDPGPAPILTLETRDLDIYLGRSLNSLAGDRTFCRVRNVLADLTSPCLVSGDNGQGKSLLAKAMAGATPTRGRLNLVSSKRQGPARLIFQDVVTQALMRSPDQILRTGSRRDQKLAASLFEQLATGWTANSSKLSEKPDRLVKVKLALTAVRLASEPPALILDEPDWGLSRRSAVSLVSSIIGLAHTMNIPVILISHKPWWHRLAKSRLEVSKHPAGNRPGHLFTIKVQPGVLETCREAKK